MPAVYGDQRTSDRHWVFPAGGHLTGSTDSSAEYATNSCLFRLHLRELANTNANKHVSTKISLAKVFHVPNDRMLFSSVKFI